MLSPEQILLIAIIIVVVIVTGTNWLRGDLVALLLLALLPLTGLTTYQEAFSGFSQSVVITIIGLFVITQALEETGVVQWLAGRLRSMGGGSELKLLLLFMSTGALLSLVMSTIAAGAVLLPAAIQVSRESDVPPSKLLMPLAFGTLMGGMATYFATASILLSGILREQGQPGLNMMDFLPTGGLIVLVGIGFMALIGRHWLPRRASVVQAATPYLLSRTLYDTYHLDEQLWEVYVPAASQLVDLPLGHSRIGQALGLTVLSIWRGPQAILTPPTNTIIRAQDYLLVLGTAERVGALADWGAEIGRPSDKLHRRQNYYVDLTEVVIPPRSNLIGHSLAELQFRSKYQLTAVALWRAGTSFMTDVGQMVLEVGDALLMVGRPAQIRMLSQDRNFMVLQSSHAARPPLPQKARWALTITTLVFLASSTRLIPTGQAVMLGVAALALTGCINLDAAYRGVTWRVVFLVAGMLPLSIAMVNTGLAEYLAQRLVWIFSPLGSLALIAGFFLITVFFTQILSGQVTALLVGPVAVTAALDLGVTPQAVAVTVAMACSAAFLTPIAHPVNVLMMGPGSYTQRDFLKLGSVMIAVTLITLLLGMQIFWDI
jgi:di/tricarboxylate transporter